VAGGGVIDAKGIRVEYLRVGPITQRDTQVVVLPQSNSAIEHEGLLGISFLRHHKHTIDMQRQVIVWLSE
jgi:predicted aspartyl protease